MSRKRKKNRNQPQLPNTPSYPARPPVNHNVTGNFDAAEDQIRGDEILLKEDLRKAKQVQELKKELDDKEVDRRLEELRKQLGLPKK